MGLHPRDQSYRPRRASLARGTAGVITDTRIKFCGTTSAQDAHAALEAGADLVGMILAPSPRRVTLAAARDIASDFADPARLVAVLVNPTADELSRVVDALPSAILQFSGDESAELCRSSGRPFIKVLHVEAAAVEPPAAATIEAYGDGLVMFDTASVLGGGSGRSFPWHLVAPLARERKIGVSGGLYAGNVGDVMRAVRPHMVDVRSGIETGGVKDSRKMRAFVRAVREAEIHAKA